MHVDREMISVSPIAATHSYAAVDFTQFVWTFKEVALPEH